MTAGGMTIEQAIGHRISQLRKREGITQQDLGDRIGKQWNRQAIWSAEKGKRAFTAQELCDLAGALGVDPGALLGSTAEPLPVVDEALIESVVRAVVVELRRRTVLAGEATS